MSPILDILAKNSFVGVECPKSKRDQEWALKSLVGFWKLANVIMSVSIKLGNNHNDCQYILNFVKYYSNKNWLVSKN